MWRQFGEHVDEVFARQNSVVNHKSIHLPDEAKEIVLMNIKKMRVKLPHYQKMMKLPRCLTVQSVKWILT